MASLWREDRDGCLLQVLALEGPGKWYCRCLWLVPASASRVVSRVAHMDVAWDRCILGGLTSAIVLSLALKAVNQVNGFLN